VKCEGHQLGQQNEELRQYRPRSDFLVLRSESTLPRVLVEVNSTSVPTNGFPKDLIRMLITGAFIVRFANKFVRGYKEHKTFVLCAMFVWDDGSVNRYTLFQQEQQQQNCQQVGCTL
jgi:hypothetical protein